MEVQADKLAVATEGLRKEIAALRSEVATRGDLAALRTELRADMTELRAHVYGGIADLRADVRELSGRYDRLFIWLAGTQVATLLAVIGLLAGVLYRSPR